MFKVKAEDKNARTGMLKTAHGNLQTPFFMPVATKAAFKWVPLETIRGAGIECFISNGYLLSLRPGLEVLKKAGGLHKFMNWNKGIFTDSGGFQLLSDDFLIKIKEQGVVFRNPFDKNRELLTPEGCMELQGIIGSDVAMCLDDVPRLGSKIKRLEESTERTFEWAKRCSESHQSKKQMLFGITQGGTSKRLRKKSSEQIASLPFDGVALGGLCIGEGPAKMHEMVSLSTKILPNEKARYLMGVGSPADLLECISLGVDIFDSCFPTRVARHGMAFTKKGNITITRGSFKFDFKPLDKDCSCPVCKEHSRAYLHHLAKVKEENAKLLLSTHNIYFVAELIKGARKAIEEGTFTKFRRQFRNQKGA